MTVRVRWSTTDWQSGSNRAFPSRRYSLLLDQTCLRLERVDGVIEWIAPCEAIFPVHGSMDRELRSTLLQLHLPLVEPPDEVMTLLKVACRQQSTLSTASPAAVRSHLAQLGAGFESDLTDAQCQQLLQHCLLDLDVEALSPTSVAPEAELERARIIRDEVQRLPLLPLRDGSRASFEATTSWLVLCAANDWRLRPKPSYVVAIDPASTLGCKLMELADAFGGKLSLLPAVPLQLLPRLLLPSEWHGTYVQPLADADGIDNGRSAVELGRVLAFISSHHSTTEIPDSFSEWPIVPATDGSAHVLAGAASESPRMLHMWECSQNGALISCLERLGCKQLHPAVQTALSNDESECITLHPSLATRAPALSVHSALSALHQMVATEGAAQVLADTENLPHSAMVFQFSQRLSEAAPAERHALRNFLATQPDVAKGAPLCAHESLLQTS